MHGEVGARTRVVCQNCQYEELVEAGADRLPGEVLIEHGQSTGHRLRVEYPER